MDNAVYIVDVGNDNGNITFDVREMLKIKDEVLIKKHWRISMSEQYQKGMLVSNYLEKLVVNPITIAEATSDENYQKSYRLIKDNPKITKSEFLTQMQIEEYED